MKILLVPSFIMICSIQLSAQLSPSQLASDLEQLQELIESKHSRPFGTISQEDFRAIVASSKEYVLSNSDCDETCLVELYKVIAAIHDGHSSISTRSRYSHFGYLPFTAKWFDDGLYIVEVSNEYDNVLGHKVEAIDGVKIDYVLEKLRGIVPHANESRFKKFAGSYLHLPGLLYGLGISKNPEGAVITFSRKDAQFDMEIFKMTPEVEEGVEFISFLDGKEALPLFQKNNDLYYWYEYDEVNELLYFQYNRIGNMDSEPSRQFAERLWSTVDSVNVDKFVLDIRYNGGGSFPYSLRFIQGLIERFNGIEDGKLYIITGYETFSAAILMLNQLELRSEAIIVGEPPCDHPASPGDSESYTLDFTQTIVNISSLYHPTLFEDDQRTSTLLDKEISTSWIDYSSGFDPVMSYILNHDQSKGVVAEAKEYAQSMGIYEYSLTRNMQLREVESELWLEVDHALKTPLYVNETGVFETEIVGLFVELNDSRLILHFPDGSSKGFNRIDETSQSPIEFIYQGAFSDAEKVYLKIKRTNPNYIELQDHQMSFLASIVYFDLRNNPEVDASGIAKKILNLGIELNEGNAPFCEFSLRFY